MLSRLSKRTFYAASPILWAVMPVAHPLLDLVPVTEEVEGQEDPMSRWSIYSDFVRQIDVGPMIFTRYQAGVLLKAAVSTTPLFRNLECILLDPTSQRWDDPYILKTLGYYECMEGGTSIQGNGRHFSFAHSGFFAIMALCPTVHTFFYGYTLPRNLLDFECLLVRAPHLSAFGICGDMSENREDFDVGIPCIRASSDSSSSILGSSVDYGGSGEVSFLLDPFDDKAARGLLFTLGCCDELDRFSLISSPSYPHAYSQIRSLTISGSIMFEFDHGLLGSYLPGLETFTVRNGPKHIISSNETLPSMLFDRPFSFPALENLRFEDVGVGFVAEVCKVGCITSKLKTFLMVDGLGLHQWFFANGQTDLERVLDILRDQAPNLASVTLTFTEFRLRMDSSRQVRETATLREPLDMNLA
ncbi:hypothetical protein RSOLAG22IIIB_08347 [Rhizoctonia solani]|uniref:Uncharacterized protein n=1 Tax=Rhizoctonia solani TaxID=456999 RepID=A0A0K6FSZ6_9AGAM|nr:hypothetical protein RSOLAG22IIIB_08347 [Rhizoctonia solani]